MGPRMAVPSTIISKVSHPSESLCACVIGCCVYAVSPLPLQSPYDGLPQGRGWPWNHRLPVAVQGLTPPIPLRRLGVESSRLPLLLPGTQWWCLSSLELETPLLQSSEH